MGPSQPNAIISTFLHLALKLPDRFKRLRRWSFGSVIVVLMLLTRPRRQGDYRSVFLALPLDAPKLFGENPPSVSSFSVARRKVPMEIMRWLLGRVVESGQRLRTPLIKRQRKRRFLAIDGVNFVVPNSKKLRQSCERPKYNTWLRAHYPQAKVLVVFDVLRRLPLDFALLAKRAGERAGLTALYDIFLAGDVLIMDRGFPARWLLRELVQRGCDVIVRMTATRLGSFPEVTAFVASGKESRTLTLDLGKGVTCKVRLLRKNFRAGRPKRHQRAETMVVMTTLGAEEFNRDAVLDFYAKRWGIETLFREMKHAFAIERFHARSVNGILQEIAAVLLWSALASVIQIAAESNLPDERRAMRTLCLDATERIVLALLTDDDPGPTLPILLIGIRRHAYLPVENRSYPRECKRPWGRWAGKKAKKRPAIQKAAK